MQDVYSYNMEQAKGCGGNNIVTVLMHAKDVDLQTASDLVGIQFDMLMQRFTAAKSQLPSWGAETDRLVAAYVRSMEDWVIGNLEWSFETVRYFGPEHARIKDTRVVILRPRTFEEQD